jgi:hypothetical protein
MYENEAASRLELLFARALRVQLSDTEQEAARATLEAEVVYCRLWGRGGWGGRCARVLCGGF